MIRWRCINTSSLVHAFDGGDENRVAVCGRRNRFAWGWPIPWDDARRCADCERGLAARGIKA